MIIWGFLIIRDLMVSRILGNRNGNCFSHHSSVMTHAICLTFLLNCLKVIEKLLQMLYLLVNSEDL